MGLVGVDFNGMSTAQDVDRETTAAILAATGGVHEELKNLRRGLFCLFVILRPNQFTPLQVKEATEVGNDLITLHEKIETLIGEGKDFKLKHGLK